MAKHWYVLRVANGREDKVCLDLVRRIHEAGLEGSVGQVLSPTEKVSEIKQGVKRVRERKLYPGYLMIEMEITEELWFLLRETPGVGDFLGAEGEPVPMAATEVEKILGDLSRSADEPVSLKVNFHIGDQVKIREGAFENFEGTVDEIIPARGKVRVIVTIFGRLTPIELEYWQVEAV